MRQSRDLDQLRADVAVNSKCVGGGRGASHAKLMGFKKHPYNRQSTFKNKKKFNLSKKRCCSFHKLSFVLKMDSNWLNYV